MLLLASCGKPSAQPEQAGQSAVESGVFEETEPTFDLSAEIETEAQQPQAKELTCTALTRDGKVYGFEMRFRRTDAIDAMMRSADNFYFGVLQSGKKKIAVPTEEIRVLVDVPTDSFVLTLLVPLGEKLTRESVTVSFYISALADGTAKALFAAQQTVEIS
jgi:hypothetical protein